MSGEIVVFLPTKGRTVACSVCGTRGLKDGYWQNTHRKGHVTCTLCGKMFSVGQGLGTHTRLVHPS